VYVDNVEIGTTPVSHSFLYYGKRQIRLVKPGYETLTVLQSMQTPWYQYPPLDFFSENLVPWEIRDEPSFSFPLTPQRLVPQDELLGRAEGLRAGSVQTAAGVAGPSGASGVAPTDPSIRPLPSIGSSQPGTPPGRPSRRIWPTPDR
jgi:hypothetical protein